MEVLATIGAPWATSTHTPLSRAPNSTSLRHMPTRPLRLAQRRNTSKAIWTNPPLILKTLSRLTLRRLPHSDWPVPRPSRSAHQRCAVTKLGLTRTAIVGRCLRTRSSITSRMAGNASEASARWGMPAPQSSCLQMHSLITWGMLGNASAHIAATVSGVWP